MAFALQHWILPCKSCIYSMTIDLNNIIATENVRYDIVSANFSHMVDTKSVLIPCKGHPRAWIPWFAYTQVTCLLISLNWNHINFTIAILKTIVEEKGKKDVVLENFKGPRPLEHWKTPPFRI